MNAVFLTLFLSLGLVAFSILLFAVTHKGRDLEHSDRLSLLPLENDSVAPATTRPQGKQK